MNYLGGHIFSMGLVMIPLVLFENSKKATMTVSVNVAVDVV